VISERLRSLRKSRGLTQVQLGQASNVAQNYISALECGTAKNPSAEVIGRLAAGLQVSESELTARLLPRPQLLDTVNVPSSNREASEPPQSPAARTGREYRGYRVMAARPEGGIFCAYVAVEVDGQPLPMHYRESRDVEWGYLGAGPQALAYDILAHEYGETLARNHLHAFTENVVAQLPSYGSKDEGAHLEWALTSAEIRDWLLKQGRPEHIRVYVPLDDWTVGADGIPRTTVVARFLPERRLRLELALEYSDTSAYRKVLSAREQELREGPGPWLLWHDVREVAQDEYLLLRY
jgi:transcriptional regulator with XRE-family HTH domain